MNNHSTQNRNPYLFLKFLIGMPILLLILSILLFIISKPTFLYLYILLLLIILINSVLTIVLIRKLLFCGQQLQTIYEHATALNEMDSSPSSSTNKYEIINDVLCQYEGYLQKNMAEQLLIRGLELDAWQHQINPHFLYNTLETIRSQAIEDNSYQSAEMIELLGHILRYSLSKHSNLCTIDQELKCVNDYFRIQQYRFGNRFQLDVKIDKNDFQLHRYKIPRLTMQPIIENSIFHGLDSKTGIGNICIDIQRTANHIIISVIDDGIGIHAAKLRDLNSALQSFNYKQRLSSKKDHNFGLALQNINARVKLLYGYDYGITVISNEGFGTRVVIMLPVENSYEG